MRRLTIVTLMLATSVNAQTTEPRISNTVLLAQPTRVLDTRLPGCQLAVIWPYPQEVECHTGRLHDGETRYTQFQAFSVPFHANGVILNVTVVNPTGDGYLTLYDPFPVTTDVPLETRPLVSSINFSGGKVTSNLVFVSLGQWQFQAWGVPFRPDSAIYTHVVDEGTTDVVVDVVGYLY